MADEKGNPITDAYITLTDNTAVTARGISNLNRRFVIPTNLSEGTIHITHVAFQPLNRHYTAGDIGTLHLKPANISLDSVQITATIPH